VAGSDTSAPLLCDPELASESAPDPGVAWPEYQIISGSGQGAARGPAAQAWSYSVYPAPHGHICATFPPL